MNLTDYVVDIALMLVVLLQIRESRMGLRFVLLPLVLVGVAAHSYMHTIPTAGNDLLLTVVLGAVGLVFGLGSGLATRVRTDGGAHALARAGVVAAGLWLLGMGFRMGFQLYSSHGGQDAIARFSVTHHITSAAAWTAALVIMALAEVVTRTAVLAIRDRLATAHHKTPAAVPVSV
jgi:hypothetical protein